MKNNDSYTVHINDRPTTFTHLGIVAEPALESITAAAVVAFDKKGDIVVVNLHSRGYDLPGGHVESLDKSAQETARREAMEEAMITVKDMYLIEVIQSDYFPDRPSYMVIYAAKLDQLLPFQVNRESSERLLISSEEFLKHYTVGDARLAAITIERGRALLQATR